MTGKTKADFIASAHTVWVLLAIINLPLVLSLEGYRAVAIAYVALTTSSWVFWRGCPLRIWEQTLRRKGDPDGAYEGGFIAHYLKHYFAIHVPHPAVRVVIVVYLGLLLIVSVS